MSFSEIFEKLSDWINDFLSDVDSFVQNFDEKKQLSLALIGAILLILFFVSFVLLVKPSTGPSILVSDERGLPVNDAWIQLYSLDGELVANSTSINGQTQFQTLPNAPYTVKAAHPSYMPTTAEYVPEDPLSAVIRLKDRSTELPTPTPPPLGPLPLPSPPVVIPTDDEQQIDPTDDDTFNKGQYVSDARLIVTAKDKQNNQPVYNAFVKLNDASSSAFLVQGQTNRDGQVEAGVKKGSSIIIQISAVGYAAVEPKTVAIANDTNQIEYLLVSQGSSGASLTRVAVLESNQTPIFGARVQIYSSPPTIDELTGTNGRISTHLETAKKFTVLATKANYLDAVKNLTSGDSVEIILQAVLPNQTIASSSLLVNVTDIRGLASKSALIGVFKLVGTTYVPLVSATADQNGLARFQTMDAGISLRVNATAAIGSPSQSKEIILAPGNNSVVLSLNYSSVNNNTNQNNQTIVQNVTTQRYFICTQPRDGPTSFTANDYNYSLTAISASNAAAFEVRKNQSVVCSAFSPDCTYTLGESTSANEAFSKLTNVNITLVSIQIQKSCVNVSASVLCTGASCNTANVCPQTKNPVCGSNGITYINSCEATRDRVAFISGYCSTQCTRQYDPVCSSNGIEYPNACRAIAANISYQSGVCLIPIGSINVDVPAGWNAIAPPNSGSLLATNCTIGYAYLFQGYNESNRQYFSVRPSFNTSSVMKFASGYLTYSTQSCRLYWENKTAPSLYEKELVQGWNLIGAPGLPTKISDMTGNCSTAVFYSIQGATDLSQYGTRMTNDEILQPGRGYWVSTIERGGARCTLGRVPTNACPPNDELACPIGTLCLKTPNGFSCKPTDSTWVKCAQSVCTNCDPNGQYCPAAQTCVPNLTQRPCGSGSKCPLYVCVDKPAPTQTPPPVPTVPEPDLQLYSCYQGTTQFMSEHRTISKLSDCGLSLPSSAEPRIRVLGNFGKAYSNPQTGSVPMYICIYQSTGGLVSYVSLRPDCDGFLNAQNLGILSYVRNAPATGFTAAYRCFHPVANDNGNWHGDFFMTYSPTCEGAAGYETPGVFAYFKNT